ncbi:MAG: hypothetical protein AB7E46_11140 [Desulfovibrio sp.]
MSRSFQCFLVFASLFILPTAVGLAADDVVNVAQGVTSSKSVNSVTIQGEDIYVDGVLQKEKYRPGTDVVLRDGKVLLVPHDPQADARKAADKAAAKAARDREKEALKAQIKAEKEAIKREALSGVEKGTTKVETGTVVNKGGTVRIGDKVYHDPAPGSEADIPPDARKLIEDAKKLGQ